MIRCIVFDFDGTLVLSNDIKHQSFFEVTNHLTGAKKILEMALSDPSFGDRYTIFQYLSEQLSYKASNLEVKASVLAEDYTILCEQKIIQAPEVMGATQVLSELSNRKIKMMISSATPEKTLQKIVYLRGMDTMFDKIYGAPDSKEQHLNDIFESSGYVPTEVVYVGDSEVDRKAALNVGCYFIGIGKDCSRFNVKPTILIDSLKNLPFFIGKL